ncbi:MAG: 2-amino-4-hydroxy-6-hydroxymethyldihydropteridine diphosphokinase [candidate division WOR-3 bacterium]|nr:MAG: 2-amino-4-hydroxy-6-hydroxymethyldihydropteridine diphosphokinase [candidate division WOR-3 bacterium]
MEHIYLLLGSNIGNVRQNIDRALTALKHSNIKVLKKSTARITQPWGKADQPDFLNMVVQIACEYTPRELLGILKSIEREMGRTVGERWGPRIIDLDILFYGSRTLQEDDLVIPHPHFFDRPFAVALMNDIAPQFVPPGSDMSIAEYYRDRIHERKTIHCH